MMKKLVSIITIAGGILACLTALHAQSWTGNGDGVSWGDGSNWSTNSVPSSSGIVSIEDATVVIGDQYIIQQLNLDEVILTINENSGLIIKGATSTALDIVGSEVNINGLLSIRNYSNSGIRMDIISEAMVSTTGLIRINAAGNIGIEIQEGALVNAGDVRIEDPSTGILNYDRINNSGTLLIDGVQAIGIDHRDGSLQNCGGGVLEIVGDTTITTNVIGIDMGGGIKNDGTIIVSSCNHDSFRFRRDTLINSDSLIIRNYRFGIFAGITSGISLIQNNVAGVILFKNPNLSNPTMGLRTTGTLNNYGLIKFVGQSQNGVFIDGPTGVFNNYGKLESADTWDGLFLTNQSTVINHVGGVMDIISDGDADYGIHNSDSLVNSGSIFIELPPHSESCVASVSLLDTAKFINNGSINTIGGSVGIRTTFSAESQPMFVNEQTGIIDILKAGRGINASGIFVNKNVVKIDSCFSYGIVLSISGFLHNNDSIAISNSFRSILIGGEFENSHYLSVLNGTGEGMGLDHFGSYRSSPKSYFELQSTTPMFVDMSSVIDIQGEFVLRTND